MAKKAEQRFSWNRNPATGIAVKTDGDTKETYEIRLDQFSEEIQDEISVYGLTKIYDDRLSQVPAALKIASCKELTSQFEKGDWKAERVGGIHILPVIISAIMLKKGWSVTQAQKAYKKLDDTQREVLKMNLKAEMLKVVETRKGEDEEISLDSEL